MGLVGDVCCDADEDTEDESSRREDELPPPSGELDEDAISIIFIVFTDRLRIPSF
jgi:hypothetical protein